MRGWMPVARAVATRPRLWVTALRQAVALAPTRWWHARPPLPTPHSAYLRFRLVTQYGDPSHRPEPADVVAYLDWCRRMHRLRYPSQP